MAYQDARRIGWGPSQIGLRVRRRGKLIRRRRDRGYIHDVFHDEKYGPGVYIMLDSDEIDAVYTHQLNVWWERSWPVDVSETVPRR